jgi:D-alanyl-lipoteichoic acid acyltransferase DltB (MBOAT superfamily)
MSLSRWLRDYLYIPLGGNRTSGVTSYGILFVILLIAAFRLKITGFTIAVIVIITLILLLYFFRPSHRKTLGTNVNNMDTMLLGGLWHGSSFNFITWGGLNGLGILVYKWWKDCRWSMRFLVLILVTAALGIASHTTDLPLLNLLYYCSFALLIGFALVYLVDSKFKIQNSKFSLGWAVAITFIFISFTRLFFRSGSNLDPAEANEQAWQTASMMVERIGSHWELSQIPDILANYWNVFLVFIIGMIVHWLPTRFKRRYRLWFASMPLWLITAVCALTAVVLYQFVTAGPQPFIYFQF